MRSAREGSVHRLTPVGELDIATVEQLRRAFDAVLADETAQVIVIDLAQLSFIDSSGLHLLLRANAACQGADRLRVLNGSPVVERLLDIVGVRDRLPIIRADADPLAPIAS